MTSHYAGPTNTLSGRRRFGGRFSRRRNIKYIGTGIIVAGMTPYLVLATWVNVFAPELIVGNYPFGTTDPISADVGGWAFLTGFPLGVVVVLVGWLVNGHIKDRDRYGGGRRLTLGGLRLATSLTIAFSAVTFGVIFQVLLMFVVGRA